jgi:L-alanine-DL-glutamate epimerase-like enolase superfamily enzyme
METFLENTAPIVRVEWATLTGQRPRKAGSNARLGEHGSVIRLPILRLMTSDGVSGFGFCRTSQEQASALLGQRVQSLFSAEFGVGERWRAYEYPLWDLLGAQTGRPVYALAAARMGFAPPPFLSVPCYDTSLYFDDLHLASEEEAAELLASEALEGVARGHRAFKIKVGRGARHLPLEAGTQRDTAIIRAISRAVWQAFGPGGTILLDANNGYNLNLAKQVLSATADCGIFWLEEPFHEDPVLYRDLKQWLEQQGLKTLIADGEGQASPTLLDWAREHLVDVIQYDIFGHGFTRWLETGQQLDAWGVRSAPHHYGGHYGNYAACHLAAAIQNFAFVEWDEATTPGLDTSGYTIREGSVKVPATPGFGLKLEEAVFADAVRNGGFCLP